MNKNEEDWPNRRKMRREENYTKEVKGDKSFKEGMVNRVPYCRNLTNKEWKYPCYVTLWRCKCEIIFL